jgi:hypothetical protein
MQWRWIIRLCFILPVLVSAAGWLLSAKYYGFVRIDCSGRLAGFFTEPGVTAWGCGSPGATHFGVERGLISRSEWQFWPEYPRGFLGFRLDHESIGLINVYWVEIPYWFWIMFWGVVLGLAWRRTRRKNAPASFPVEALPPS